MFCSYANTNQFFFSCVAVVVVFLHFVYVFDSSNYCNLVCAISDVFSLKIVFIWICVCLCVVSSEFCRKFKKEGENLYLILFSFLFRFVLCFIEMCE